MRIDTWSIGRQTWGFNKLLPQCFPQGMSRLWILKPFVNSLAENDDFFSYRAHRYKLEVCHLTGLASSPSLTHSCHLPNIPNGTIPKISHTYSITKSHAPFRIKINLACDDGYHLKKTFRTAECQNGSWTQLPVCLGKYLHRTFYWGWFAPFQCISLPLCGISVRLKRYL